jgi:hypothetical protein
LAAVILTAFQPQRTHSAQHDRSAIPYRTQFHRIDAADEDEWDRARRGLDSQARYRTARRRNSGNPSGNQLGGQGGQAIELIVCPAEFDGYILARPLGEPLLRNPITGIADGCARATAGHAAGIERGHLQNPP